MAQKAVHPQSVYDVIELIGTSTVSWEDAAKNAVEEAAKHLRDLRVADVVKKDLVIRDGKVEAYRAKLKLSFKYERDHGCSERAFSTCMAELASGLGRQNGGSFHSSEKGDAILGPTISRLNAFPELACEVN